MTLDFMSNFYTHSYKWNHMFELIVVDNGSGDETKGVVDFYKKRYDNIKYIRNPENYGFGKANNIGVENSEGKLLWFLSNDVVTISDPIINVIDGVIENAIMGARLITFDTGWNNFVELPNPIHYIEGWSLLCWRKDFDKIKWDERYFTDYEDLDFCYNAQLKGMKLQQIDMPLRHIGGQTATSLPQERINYTLDSQRKFCEKWELTLRK